MSYTRRGLGAELAIRPVATTVPGLALRPAAATVPAASTALPIPADCSGAGYAYAPRYEAPPPTLLPGSTLVYGALFTAPSAEVLARWSAFSRQVTDSLMRRDYTTLDGKRFLISAPLVSGKGRVYTKLAPGSGGGRVPFAIVIELPASLNGGYGVSKSVFPVAGVIETARRAVGLPAPGFTLPVYLPPGRRSRSDIDAAIILATGSLSEVVAGLATGIHASALRVPSQGFGAAILTLRRAADELGSYDAKASEAVARARGADRAATFEEGTAAVAQARKLLDDAERMIGQGSSYRGRDIAADIARYETEAPGRIRDEVSRRLSTMRLATPVERRVAECMLWGKAVELEAQLRRGIATARAELTPTLTAYDAAQMSEGAARARFAQARGEIDKIEDELVRRFGVWWQKRGPLGLPVWGWILGGTVVVGGGGLLLLRRAA